MKILLLGANGQVGWECRRSLSLLGKLLALGRQGVKGYCGDLCDEAALITTLEHFEPDVIVNAAAYTAVDQAETEPKLAHTLNADAPRLLGNYACRSNALLIHYSTDYVFDGSGLDLRSESAEPDPINVYGQSKLQGEQAIRESGCKAIIFRTSWVYSTWGKSFVSTMMRLIREKPELSVIDDQVGAPTGAPLIADVTAMAVHAYQQGSLSKSLLREPLLLHLASSGRTSWYHYACYIKECMQRHKLEIAATIQPIATQDYPTLAQRPLNSRLDTSRLAQLFGLQLPDWHDGVAHVVAERAHLYIQ